MILTQNVPLRFSSAKVRKNSDMCKFLWCKNDFVQHAHFVRVVTKLGCA